jgi:hypothetical protein
MVGVSSTVAPLTLLGPLIGLAAGRRRPSQNGHLPGQGSPLAAFWAAPLKEAQSKAARGSQGYKRTRSTLSLFRHPRLAQALEQPLVVGHSFWIVGQRQLLLSQLGDGLADDQM